MIRFDGNSWSELTNAGSRQNLRAVRGVDGQVFVAGWSGTVVRQSAGTWSTLVTAPTLFSVWAVDGSAYAVGLGGLVLKRQSTTWSPMAVPPKPP